MPEQKWHNLKIEHAFTVLGTSATGLSSKSTIQLQKQFGPNKLPKFSKKKPSQILLEQFLSPLIYVLVVVAIITLLMKRYIDSSVITLILISNALIGYFQEIKAGAALEKLENYLTINAKVLRDSELCEIAAENLVPGDIVIIEPGSKIPADLRIIESIDLRIDEATLTGESLPTEKYIKTLHSDTNLADRHNMAYSGTFATSGRGRGLVVATGLDTEFGHIASSLETAEPPESPLEKELKHLSKQLVIIILLATVALLIIGTFRHLDGANLFLTAVNLAVSVIPEGLPAIMTITLAIGVLAMARRKAIIRSLPVVETLGAVTLVATDKTGTLTKDMMIIEKIFIDPYEFTIDGDGYTPIGHIHLNEEIINLKDHSALQKFLTTGALCNDSSLVKEKDDWKIIGDPTEGSLITAAAKANILKPELEEKYPRLDEIPFHTAKRFMATLHQSNDDRLIAIKGASEKVINFCSHFYKNNESHTLTSDHKKALIEKTRELSSKGYRVLMLAEKPIKKDNPLSSNDIREHDLEGSTLLGLCAMKDAPRKEAHMAIHQAHRAGIRVVMITGDHALTAQSVAESVDITNEPVTSQHHTVATGDIIDTLTPTQLDQLTKYCNVYSRISPLGKLKLVKQFQKQGHIVAVTGDGINDSAALKQADIGIAMGKTGTDISREAANMVLANDNFATIIAAISEGRAIYNNIKRVLLYLLSTNIGEMFVIMLALIVGTHLPNDPAKFILPVVPIQILLINILTDTVASFPLAVEPRHEHIMKIPPRGSKERILDRLCIWRILIVATTMAIGTILLFNYELSNSGYESARTVAFATIIIFQLFNMFNCRSLNQSILNSNFFKNIYVTVSFLIGLVITILIIYLPFLQKIFYTTNLDLGQWIRITLISLSVIIVIEIEKYFRNLYKSYII